METGGASERVVCHIAIQTVPLATCTSGNQTEPSAPSGDMKCKACRRLVGDDGLNSTSRRAAFDGAMCECS